MRNRHNVAILRRWFLFSGMILIQVLSGCQSPSNYYPNEIGTPQEPTSELATSEIALAAGDILEVKFFYTPQLNENQTVRPDGKITLQLIGEVEVEGKTPSELQTELLKLYSVHLKDPEIVVIVRSFYNRRVFVGGQVMQPGVIEMPGRLTLLEAIMQSGGFNTIEAEMRNVIVIRYKNDQRYGYSVNLEPALKKGENKPFFLEAKDIVYVPQTEIVKVGQWIDQHINKLVPQTGFYVGRRMGNTTIGIDTSSD